MQLTSVFRVLRKHRLRCHQQFLPEAPTQGNAADGMRATQQRASPYYQTCSSRLSRTSPVSTDRPALRGKDNIIRQALDTMFPAPLDSAIERAEHKGRDYGLAMADSARLIQVDVHYSSVHPDTATVPRRISFKTEQSTSESDLVTKIKLQIPKVQYPVTVLTVGPNRRELNPESKSWLGDLLQPWDAAFITLRLHIDVPKLEAQRKKTLGSRLRKTLGASNDRLEDSQDIGKARSSDLDSTARQTSLGDERAAPPSYEEATR